MFEIITDYWRASHSRENGQAWLPTARTRQVSTECPCNVAAKHVAVDKQQSVTGKSWEVLVASVTFHSSSRISAAKGGQLPSQRLKAWCLNSKVMDKTMERKLKRS